MQSTEKSADSHGDDTATCHSATSLSPYHHTMQHHTIIPPNQTIPYHTVPCNIILSCLQTIPNQTKLQPVTLSSLPGQGQRCTSWISQLLSSRSWGTRSPLFFLFPLPCPSPLHCEGCNRPSYCILYIYMVLMIYIIIHMMIWWWWRNYEEEASWSTGWSLEATGGAASD